MKNYTIEITLEMKEVTTVKAKSKREALEIIDKERKGIMELTKSEYFNGVKNVNIV